MSKKEKTKLCPKCSTENALKSRVCKKCYFRWILPEDKKPAAPVRKSLTHKILIGFGWFLILTGAFFALNLLVKINTVHAKHSPLLIIAIAAFMFLIPFMIGRMIIGQIKKKYDEDDFFEIYD